VGLYYARSVYASAIVRKWPFAAQVTSLTRRLRRFLDNRAVQVPAYYRSTAQQVLTRAAGGEVTLLVDSSKVGFGHQWLLVAVAYRRRALPVVWTWLRGPKGHSAGEVQVALLAQVRQLLPGGVRVRLVGDAEFGVVALMRACDRWGWQYVLRQKGSHRVQPSPGAAWCALADLVTRPGQSAWYPQACLTEKWQQPARVYAYWAPGETAPWLLATNLPEPAPTHRVYARRMWIEELFGDLKGHGFDLEATHLRHPQRLSRLTLAVCLLYVWLVLGGQRTIRAGLRYWVDRRNRRDLSLFRIGADFIERCLILNHPCFALAPPVSGG
jgi:hypothetical protein